MVQLVIKGGTWSATIATVVLNWSPPTPKRPHHATHNTTVSRPDPCFHVPAIWMSIRTDQSSQCFPTEPVWTVASVSCSQLTGALKHQLRLCCSSITNCDMLEADITATFIIFQQAPPFTWKLWGRSRKWNSDADTWCEGRALKSAFGVWLPVLKHLLFGSAAQTFLIVSLYMKLQMETSPFAQSGVDVLPLLWAVVEERWTNRRWRCEKCVWACEDDVTFLRIITNKRSSEPTFMELPGFRSRISPSASADSFRWLLKKFLL